MIDMLVVGTETIIPGLSLKQSSLFIYLFIYLLFDQQGFAEAKAHKKPGKIYCFSTFRGHRDSIIKRLVK